MAAECPETKKASLRGWRRRSLRLVRAGRERRIQTIQVGLPPDEAHLEIHRVGLDPFGARSELDAATAEQAGSPQAFFRQLPPQAAAAGGRVDDHVVDVAVFAEKGHDQ